MDELNDGRLEGARPELPEVLTALSDLGAKFSKPDEFEGTFIFPFASWISPREKLSAAIAELERRTPTPLSGYGLRRTIETPSDSVPTAELSRGRRVSLDYLHVLYADGYDLRVVHNPMWTLSSDTIPFEESMKFVEEANELLVKAGRLSKKDEQKLIDEAARYESDGIRRAKDPTPPPELILNEEKLENLPARLEQVEEKIREGLPDTILVWRLVVEAPYYYFENDPDGHANKIAITRDLIVRIDRPQGSLGGTINNQGDVDVAGGLTALIDKRLRVTRIQKGRRYYQWKISWE